MSSTQPHQPNALLEKNLEALASSQPLLCERLHWPVEGDHLSMDANGRPVLRYRGCDLNPVLGAEEIEQACRSVSRDGTGATFLLGVGLGELLAALLERAPHADITAWERDPWLLRCALTKHDWSEPLASGRLRLALNADLGTVLESNSFESRVSHPLLARVYGNERQLLEQGVGPRRALVCTGTLFVDSMADSLRTQGFSVLSFDAMRISSEESDLVFETWTPDLVACVNGIDGLAELCESHGVPSITWEIDPALTEPRRLMAPAPLSHVFTYRRASVTEFQRAGYSNITYAPLAADPSKRSPQTLDAAQIQRYGAQVSFVGASLVPNVASFRREFIARLQAWRAVSESEANAVIQRVLQLQRMDYSHYAVPDCLDGVCPGFRDHEVSNGAIDPARYLGEIAAAEKRLNTMAALAAHAPAVWGDSGWQRLQDHGVRYLGSALHETELPLIYSGSTINVDVGRIYQNDIVTMRIFDILACGGFVLAEHSPALKELFEIGVEVESYSSLTELQEKVAYYLEHPEAARTIAERGRQAVLERHTIDQRIEAMLHVVATNAASLAA